MTETISRVLLLWLRRWNLARDQTVEDFERLVRNATAGELAAWRDDVNSCRAFVDRFDELLTREEERRREMNDGS